MKLLKRASICLLAAAMALSMLTACGGSDGGGTPEQPSASAGDNNGAQEPEQPTQPTTPEEPVQPPTPEEPALPTNWAESRTNAYFTRLGVTKENVYEEYEGIVEGDSGTYKAAAKNGKLYWEGVAAASAEEQQHVAAYVDEQGNAYEINFEEREIESYKAGTTRAESTRLYVQEMLELYIPIPTADDVAKVSATKEYQYNNRNYYAESIKIRVKLDDQTYDQTYTDEWDYLFDENELKYVVLPGAMGGITIKVNKIEANPADSVFALPDWYSKNFDSSRTSNYFKSLGVSKDRYSVELTLKYSGNPDRKLIGTVNGKRAYAGRSNWWDDSAIAEGNLVLGDASNYYYINYQDKVYYGPQTIDQAQCDSYFTVGGCFIIPDASNTLYMTSGTELDGVKSYYKENFYVKTSDGTYMYSYYFDGNKLAYIKIDGSNTVIIDSISSVPKEELLNVPEGFRNGMQQE